MRLAGGHGHGQPTWPGKPLRAAQRQIGKGNQGRLLAEVLAVGPFEGPVPPLAIEAPSKHSCMHLGLLSEGASIGMFSLRRITQYALSVCPTPFGTNVDQISKSAIQESVQARLPHLGRSFAGVGRHTKSLIIVGCGTKTLFDCFFVVSARAPEPQNWFRLVSASQRFGLDRSQKWSKSGFILVWVVSA